MLTARAFIEEFGRAPAAALPSAAVTIREALELDIRDPLRKLKSASRSFRDN